MNHGKLMMYLYIRICLAWRPQDGRESERIAKPLKRWALVGETPRSPN